MHSAFPASAIFFSFGTQFPHLLFRTSICLSARFAFLILLMNGGLFPSVVHSQLRPPDQEWVEHTLKTMTLNEKIGQLFMPVHRNLDESLNLIRQYRIGGLWVARAEATTLAADLNSLQRASSVPLLISADFEKGVGTYIDGATDVPSNMALGASRNPETATEAAALTAKEARAIGIHVNFAPVLDVNNNPRNPVINIRSYGEDPALVSRLAIAAVNGYQQNGLLATGKHFPGHGNTSTDTHSSVAVIEGSKKDFENIELFPYKEVLSKTSLANVMTAHIWIRAVDRDTIPATLSSTIITDILRKRLRFNGVVYTDAMVMGGITTRYSFGTAVVNALTAGCDVILFPGSVEQGVAAIKSAIQNGTLTEGRIDESVRRILRSKTQVSLHVKKVVETETIWQTVGTKEYYEIAKSISKACLTLVKDERKLLPLNVGGRILVITMSNKEGNSMLSRGLVSFPQEVQARAKSVAVLKLSETLGEEERRSAVELAGWAETVVLAAYVKIVLNSGTVELSPLQRSFIGELTKRNPNTIVVSFGNPYIGASLPSVSTYICAYDNARALQEAAAEALCTTFAFKGKLPVSISEQYPFGHGWTTD